MVGNHSFRDALRREVESVELPPEWDWVPGASRGARAWSRVVVAVITATIAIAAIGTASVIQSAAEQSKGVTPPTRPTVIDGRSVVPLPNEHRDAQSAYNLLLPAWFRSAPRPALAGEAGAGLIDRKVFTGRSDADEARLMGVAGTQSLPWDLTVEVWQSRGRSAEDWTNTFGCGPSTGPVGSSCVLSTTQIYGTRAVVATRTGQLPGKTYLIERGDQLLVMRYVIGDESNRPQDVTEATLEQIIGSLGLP